MDDFGAILKKLRKKSGITQDKLADQLGIRKTTISNYETGYSSPSKETLMEMATIFEVSMDQLLGREKSSLHETQGSRQKDYTLQTIPLLGNVHDGIGLLHHAQYPQLKIPLSLSSDGNDYFALTMDNERMNLSQISKGDTIILKKQTSADNGDLVVLIIDNNLTFIGHYYQNDHQTTLMPNSSDKQYEPLFYPTGENKVRVLGKAVKVLVSL